MSSVILTQLPENNIADNYGELRFSVTDAVNNRPISGADIEISAISTPETRNQ